MQPVERMEGCVPPLHGGAWRRAPGGTRPCRGPPRQLVHERLVHLKVALRFAAEVRTTAPPEAGSLRGAHRAAGSCAHAWCVGECIQMLAGVEVPAQV